VQDREEVPSFKKKIKRKAGSFYYDTFYVDVFEIMYHIMFIEQTTRQGV